MEDYRCEKQWGFVTMNVFSTRDWLHLRVRRGEESFWTKGRVHAVLRAYLAAPSEAYE
jgi:hypothetical protein